MVHQQLTGIQQYHKLGNSQYHICNHHELGNSQYHICNHHEFGNNQYNHKFGNNLELFNSHRSNTSNHHNRCNTYNSHRSNTSKHHNRSNTFNHRFNKFSHRFYTLSLSIITIKNHGINQEFKDKETILPTTVDDIIVDTDMKMMTEDFWIEYLTEIKMYIIYIYLKIKIKF